MCLDMSLKSHKIIYLSRTLKITPTYPIGSSVKRKVLILIAQPLLYIYFMESTALVQICDCLGHFNESW